MFTGVIETTGVVEKIIKRRNSISLDVSSKISKDLKIDDSISHNGVCLTITSSNKYSHLVTLVEETLNKSIFKSVSKGDLINLERSLLVGSRLDGHLVQGHVDEVAECIRISENELIITCVMPTCRKHDEQPTSTLELSGPLEIVCIFFYTLC